MKTIVLAHQEVGCEQLTLDMLRAMFADTLRICAFRRDADCCNSAACKRASEFDRAGYQLFVQHCVEDGTLSLPASGDLTLVQIREPTLRALDKYARDLAKQERRHSVDTLQSWLADDAVRTIEFWRKWSAAPRGFLLRAEALAASAHETLDAALSAAGIHADDEALARAGDVAAASPGAEEVSVRSLERNPYFVRLYFTEYLNLLAQEAEYLGYPPWQEPRPAAGPITTIYRSRHALAERDFEQVLAILGPFVAVNPVEPDLRVMLGEALLETGREVEGRRALDNVLKSHPDHFEAAAVLARHAYGLGLSFEGRAILREAMARHGGTAWAREFLRQGTYDPEFMREMPEEAEPAVSREAVIEGFSWILGRRPESEQVIEDHRRLRDEDDLRLSLLHSQEFRDFHERFEAGTESAPGGGPGAVTRADLLGAVRWLLGRALRSRDEAEDLLRSATPAALRLKLIGHDEFAASWRHLMETY